MKHTALLLSLSVLAASPAAVRAEDVGQHPAVATARALPGVDPSTFIVGHPASPTTRGGHANDEHPAVVTAREAAKTPLSADTFIVQPPATARWTLEPADAKPAARTAAAAR